jgi:PucR C-terminal helix-turn-helix domain/GGDEF-like domain
LSANVPAKRELQAQARAELIARLQARQPEIEQTILSRVYAVSDPAEVGDPTYVGGLREAVFAALAYAIQALENVAERPDPVPAPLLSQARRAARDGVSLDTVLRRYLAGHALLGDFIVQELEEVGDDLSDTGLQSVLRREAAVLDHLLSVVAGEYRSESEATARSLHRRRADCVDKLLAGKLTDPGELGYDLELWHVGVIAVGKGAEAGIRALATALDRRLLLVHRGEETFWAWLGGIRRMGRDDLERLVAWEWPGQVRVATGEPAKGLVGWRFSHEQAGAALPIAMGGAATHVRYADVALLASMLKDEVLLRSLDELYLAPLAAGAIGEETLCETLRAYFSAQRNVSSTASALGVSRKTVGARLRTIEQRLGRSLDTCSAELELALRLEESGAASARAEGREEARQS